MPAMYQIVLPCGVERAMAETQSLCADTGAKVSADPRRHVMTVKFKRKGLTDAVKFELALQALDEEETVLIATAHIFAAMDPEKPGDLYDKHFDPVVRGLADAFELAEVHAPAALVGAEAMGTGVGERSVSIGKNVSLGRAAVGGLLFGGAGAVVGGLSGQKTTQTWTYESFTGSIPFRLVYSNGRVIERVITKTSREFPEILALSMKTQE